MNKKIKNKDKSEEDDLSKITNLIDETPNLSQEEAKLLKDEFKKVLNRKKNPLFSILYYFSYFIKQLVLRYIILILLLALFFDYIALQNKLESFLFILYVSLFISFLSTIITSFSKKRLGYIFISLFFGVILTICLGIYTNSIYNYFSSNLALGFYLLLASILYNIINYSLLYRGLTKGI